MVCYELIIDKREIISFENGSFSDCVRGSLIRDMVIVAPGVPLTISDVVLTHSFNQGVMVVDFHDWFRNLKVSISVFIPISVEDSFEGIGIMEVQAVTVRVVRDSSVVAMIISNFHGVFSRISFDCLNYNNVLSRIKGGK